MKKLLFALMLIPTLSFGQCVRVDSVWCNKKVKQIGTRSVLLGVKQITEEILSEKYKLCDSNAISVKIEIYKIGMPSSNFKIAGAGEAKQTTQVYTRMYFGDKVVEGLGESETKAGYILIELNDDKIPFSNTTIGNALKKSILDASGKL